MPVFMIETTYRLPVYRHQTYQAATIDEACRRAIDDDDWSTEKRDYESAGKTYVTGIWSGENAAYSGTALPIPSHYVETPQRIALHFEVLLGLVKVLASQSDTERLDRAFWLERAQPAIADAILARGREPD
jgi:hypothetical protein